MGRLLGRRPRAAAAGGHLRAGRRNVLPTTSSSGRPSSTTPAPPPTCSAGIPTLARSPTPVSPRRRRTWCSPTRSPTRRWPSARIIHDIDEIRTLRQQPGKAVYVVGGPGLLTSLMNAGLLDELHLIVHPVATGGGTDVFGDFAERKSFELVSAEPMASGRVHLAYRLGHDGTNG